MMDEEVEEDRTTYTVLAAAMKAPTTLSTSYAL
jgi:hypothetical protein